jgi:hypothetical protein
MESEHGNDDINVKKLYFLNYSDNFLAQRLIINISVS